MDDVVAASTAQEMPEDTRAEHERREDPPSPWARIEPHARSDGHHSYGANLAALATGPLAKGQVGDLVPLGREALRDVAIPALGAADGVGKEAVVDEADSHSGARGCQTFRYHRRAARATSSIVARS